MPKTLGWWQAHFKDHPDRANKPGPAWIGDKVKTYCKECLKKHIAMIQSEYDDQVRIGINPMIPRETLAIETHCAYNFYDYDCTTNLLY
jgi:hypothetical protein